MALASWWARLGRKLKTQGAVCACICHDHDQKTEKNDINRVRISTDCDSFLLGAKKCYYLHFVKSNQNH